MLTEYAIGKALDAGLTWSGRKLTKSASELTCSKSDVIESISYHTTWVGKWANEVSFRDILMAKSTGEVFVPLDFYVKPRRVWLEDVESRSRQALDSLFAGCSRHFVLLGLPGAGKTTSMKHVASRLLHDEHFAADTHGVPVVARLRDLNTSHGKRTKGEKMLFTPSRSVLFPRLFALLGLGVKAASRLYEDDYAEERAVLLESLVVKLLDELQAFVILDGFDELRPDRRSVVLKELEALTSHVTRARIAVTSRTGEFPYHLSGVDVYELCPFRAAQVETFARRWLGAPRHQRFMAEMRTSPFADAALKPLTLAHLCAIFERTGRIPPKPRTVYRKIVSLLLEEWDEQRAIERPSIYAGFEADRKLEFLCNLAYELTLSVRGTVFSRRHLLAAYGAICLDYDLSEKEATNVVSEIESHNGLFLQTGHKKFEFSHKSMQEYLTAEYLVRLPSIPSSSEILAALPNELAIAATISSNPSGYLTELVLNRFVAHPAGSEFYAVFLLRLLQEKPVFNSSPSVMLALVALYSLYIEGGTQQRFAFSYDDTLVKEFGDFVALLRRRNDLSALDDYYTTEEGPKELGNANVYYLTRTKQLPGYHLPRLVYAREDFLARGHRSGQPSVET